MYLCIDVGGTKTIVATMDDRRRITHSVRFPTAFDQERFLETLTSQIRSEFNLKNLRVVSLALPGPVESGQILWLGNLPWTNFDIVGSLKKLLNVPVYLENDANLAGLAEAEHLEGLSVYLTFSTGIGGGVIRNGHIDPSIRIYEPGHDKYEFRGQLLEWEDFASAKAISEDFGKLTTKITSKSDWVEISCRMAVGLHSVVSSIRPDNIVFGGPLGLELKKYYKPLEKQLSVALPPGVGMPKLIAAKYKDKSVIYGCYVYAQQKLGISN